MEEEKIYFLTIIKIPQLQKHSADTLLYLIVLSKLIISALNVRMEDTSITIQRNVKTVIFMDAKNVNSTVTMTIISLNALNVEIHSL